MKDTYALILASTLVATACGKDNDRSSSPNPAAKQTPTGDNPSAGSVYLDDDEELASDSISAQIDDAIAAVADEQEGSAQGVWLSLKDEEKIRKVERYRACVEENATAKVTIKKSTTRNWSFQKHNREGSSEFTHLNEMTRVWSKDGAEIKCAIDKKRVDLALQEMEGVKLDVSFKREKSRNVSFTQLKRGVTKSRFMKITANGTRQLVWTDVNTTDGIVTLSKTANQTLTRTLELKNKKGEAKTLEQTVATDPTAPLVIQVEKKLDDGELISRTIISGKKIATAKDGGRIETTFENVRYEPGTGCYAVSGMIKGSLFAKDATEAGVSFTINFEGDSKTVTYSDGRETEYIADGCEFEGEAVEKDSAAIEEKETAADIK